MDTFLQIFMSVFFLFGLYCATIEAYRLSVKIYRYFKWRRGIDKEREKS